MAILSKKIYKKKQGLLSTTSIINVAAAGSSIDEAEEFIVNTLRKE